MTTTLDELINNHVRSEAGSDDKLDLLAAAAVTVHQLAETGDALLGYYVDQARAAGHTWTEISTVLGVSKQAVHKRFNGDVDFSRYTDRARQSVLAAQDGARRLGHGYIGTEHLVLGLLDDSVSDGVAATILGEHDITAAEFEEAVIQRTGRGSGSGGEQLPFTPRARKVLAANVPEAALDLGHTYIGTEHILLAVTRFEGLAQDLLADLGLTAHRARAAVITALSGYREK